MHRIFRNLAILMVLIVSGTMARAEVKTFKTVPNDGKNVVQFESDAPIEKILGHTSSVTGSIDLNLADITATVSGKFEVDLNTLDTGIGMRNDHMRDNFLETAKYPTASFVFKRFISSEKSSLKPGETTKAVAEGEFSIHGVTKTYQVPVALFYDQTNEAAASRLGGAKGDLLVVNAEFIVKLADHNIERPQMLFLKLAEEQMISVNAAMTDLLP